MELISALRRAASCWRDFSSLVSTGTGGSFFSLGLLSGVRFVQRPSGRRFFMARAAVLHVQGKRGLGNKSVGAALGGAGRRRKRHLDAVNRIVTGVALYGHSACGSNQAFEFGARQMLGRRRAGVVINLFFDHGAI